MFLYFLLDLEHIEVRFLMRIWLSQIGKNVLTLKTDLDNLILGSFSNNTGSTNK